MTNLKDNTSGETILLMPAVKDILSYLSEFENVKIGLVTGNFKQNAYLKLKAHNLDTYFPIGAFGCDYENRNSLPSRSRLKELKQYWSLNNFSYKKTIIIGDSYRDILLCES